MRRRSSRHGLWFNAAIGGLIGCGLLTLIVIIAALILSAAQPLSTSDVSASQTRVRQRLIQETRLPTLDPTSQAALDELTGRDDPR